MKDHDLKGLLIDFGLPVIVLTMCFLLIWTGRDSEIKSVFLMAAGWLFKSGYTETAAKKKTPPEPPIV